MKERRIPESPLLHANFRVGQVVPASGIYQVLHSQHRLPSEITLRGNEHFPPCAGCKSEVSFKFIRIVVANGFNCILNAIPILLDPDSDVPECTLPETAVD